MIKFECESCGQHIEVDDEFSGHAVECPCGASLEVPSPTGSTENTRAMNPQENPPAPPPPPQPQQEAAQSIPVASDNPQCPKCGANLATPDAVICIQCGHNLKLGVNAKTALKVKKAGSFGIAVLVGAIAAIISGAIWAAIAIFLNMEIGWIAILVGIITGAAVAMVTDERSPRVAFTAAGLAVLGLLIGKVGFIEYSLRSYNGVQSLDDVVISGMMVMEMNEKGEIDKEVVEWWNDSQEGDAPPANIKDKVMNAEKKIQARFAGLTKDDKKRLQKKAFDKISSSLSLVDKVKATLSFWDVLWFLLAVSTAWGIGNGTSSIGNRDY